MSRIAPLQSNDPNTSRNDIIPLSNRELNANRNAIPISNQVQDLDEIFKNKRMKMIYYSCLNLLANYILFLLLLMICVNFELSFNLILAAFYSEELLSIFRLAQNIQNKK